MLWSKGKKHKTNGGKTKSHIGLSSFAEPEGSTAGAQRADVTDNLLPLSLELSRRRPGSISYSSVRDVHPSGERNWHPSRNTAPRTSLHPTRPRRYFSARNSAIPSTFLPRSAGGDGGMIGTDRPPSPPPPPPPPAIPPAAVGLRVTCQSSELRPGCGPRCSAGLRCLRPCWRWAPAWQVRDASVRAVSCAGCGWIFLTPQCTWGCVYNFKIIYIYIKLYVRPPLVYMSTVDVNW